eukprot:m.155027 g.155027  ORF g.155027 m.155027 type:complete len:753 (+) comp14392_c0_seq4:43-2301(+)
MPVVLLTGRLQEFAAFTLLGLLSGTLSTHGLGPGPGITLTVANPPDFILPPGVLSRLLFNVSTTGKQPSTYERDDISSMHVEPASLEFELTDYTGRPVGALLQAPVQNSVTILQVKLEVGYYDIRCTLTNETFGAIVAPPFERGGTPFDSRFGVLAGFTQICNTAQVPMREPMLSMLVKMGIGRYRDFPEIGLIRPNATAPLDFDALSPGDLSGRMDELHGVNRKLGLAVLDCFVGTEKWNNPRVTDKWNRYDGNGLPWRWPRDLGTESDGYAAVVSRWGDVELGLEVENEADASAHLPADQYAVLMKTFRYGIDAAFANSSMRSVPLVCGTFTDAVHSAYLNSLCDSQLATVCDAVSYHSYTDPSNVQDDTGRMIRWIQQCSAKSGVSTLPLHVTESGTDFALRWNSTDSTGNPRGLPRPTLAEDRAYAFANAAHQIENVVIGVATSFAFNFMYYEEGGLNYGLTGHDRTPLRSLAALAAVVRFLSDKHYVGDLPNKDGPESRGRVFANDNRSDIVAAVFAGSWATAPSQPMWSWSVPILGVYGADGRSVHFSCSNTSGCQWANDDHLSWLRLAPDVLELIDNPTVASGLAEAAGTMVPEDEDHGRVRYAAPPVIVQMGYDNVTTGVDHIQTTFGSTIGYFVGSAIASSYPLTLLVHNLHLTSGGTVNISLAVSCGSHSSQAGASTSIVHNQTLTVPKGRGVTTSTFNIDLTARAEIGRTHTVVATTSGSWGIEKDWEDQLSMIFEVRTPS